MSAKVRLREVALLFLKLGYISFGGPAAHNALMYKEVVEKRGWITDQHFLDIMGATNLIPGPNSTEIAIHIGYEKAGWKGLIIAGISFIFPAALITLFFAWLYVQYGQMPEIQPYVYGIKPAIIAVILSAIYPLARKSLKSLQLILIGVAALVLSISGFNEILIMFGAGLLALLLQAVRGGYSSKAAGMVIPPAIIQGSAAGLLTLPNLGIFLIFLKIGAILYGSGYVLFAFLDQELVLNGFLTRQQLIDAIAVGQFTPGPVLSTATFVGYILSGYSGAALATLGIFLPSFIFVALLKPMVMRMRNSRLFSAFLDAVNVASIAIILKVCLLIGQEVIFDWKSILIAVTAFAAMFWYSRLNSIVFILAGAVMGYLLTFF